MWEGVVTVVVGVVVNLRCEKWAGGCQEVRLDEIRLQGLRKWREMGNPKEVMEYVLEPRLRLCGRQWLLWQLDDVGVRLLFAVYYGSSEQKVELGVQKRQALRSHTS